MAIRKILKIKNASNGYDEIHPKTNTRAILTYNGENMTSKLLDTVLKEMQATDTNIITEVGTKATKVAAQNDGKLATFTKEGDLAVGEKTITDIDTAQTNIIDLQNKVGTKTTSGTALYDIETLKNTKQKKIVVVNDITLNGGTAWTAVSGDEDVYSQNVTSKIPEAYRTNPNVMVDVQAGSTTIKQMIEDGTNAIYIVNSGETNPVFTAFAIGEKPTENLVVQFTLTEIG